ncbi:hypothetical protein C8F01DRAFT_1256183 [Mycena amicta]|nr:hypothetical protein C8F01DRAFT_1256183 [Mycena amicta]
MRKEFVVDAGHAREEWAINELFVPPLSSFSSSSVHPLPQLSLSRSIALAKSDGRRRMSMEGPRASVGEWAVETKVSSRQGWVARDTIVCPSAPSAFRAVFLRIDANVEVLRRELHGPLATEKWSDLGVLWRRLPATLSTQHSQLSNPPQLEPYTGPKERKMHLCVPTPITLSAIDLTQGGFENERTTGGWLRIVSLEDQLTARRRLKLYTLGCSRCDQTLSEDTTVRLLPTLYAHPTSERVFSLNRDETDDRILGLNSARTLPYTEMLSSMQRTCSNGYSGECSVYFHNDAAFTSRPSTTTPRHSLETRQQYTNNQFESDVIRPGRLKWTDGLQSFDSSSARSHPRTRPMTQSVSPATLAAQAPSRTSSNGWPVLKNHLSTHHASGPFPSPPPAVFALPVAPDDNIENDNPAPIDKLIASRTSSDASAMEGGLPGQPTSTSTIIVREQFRPVVVAAALGNAGEAVATNASRSEDANCSIPTSRIYLQSPALSQPLPELCSATQTTTAIDD